MLVRGFPLDDVARAGVRQLARRPQGSADAEPHVGPQREPGRVVVVHRPADPAGRRRGVGGEAARATRAVAVGFLGDGATSQPDFHAAMNFAAVSRGRRACSSARTTTGRSACRRREQTASTTIAVKAQAYGVPGVRVDGNDVLAVYRAVQATPPTARAPAAGRRSSSASRTGSARTARATTRRATAARKRSRRGRSAIPIDRFERYLRRAQRSSTTRSAAASSERARRGDRARRSSASSARRRPRARRSSTTSTPTLPWHLEEQRRSCSEALASGAHATRRGARCAAARRGHALDDALTERTGEHHGDRTATT